MPVSRQVGAKMNMTCVPDREEQGQSDRAGGRLTCLDFNLPPEPRPPPYIATLSSTWYVSALAGLAMALGRGFASLLLLSVRSPGAYSVAFVAPCSRRQSHHPSATLSAACFLGGVYGPFLVSLLLRVLCSRSLAALLLAAHLPGFSKTRSVPSLVGGFALGSLFAISAVRIKDGLDYGYEAAGACSPLLLAQRRVYLLSSRNLG